MDSRRLPWHEPPGHNSGYSKYLVNDVQGGSKHVDFRISRYPIRGEVEPHVHDVAEQIYYVISGTGLFILDGEEHIISQGFTVFIPPGVEHSLVNTGDEDIVFVVVTSPLNDIPR
jgi:quercetin dioxygenase-like cupin family protein